MLDQFFIIWRIWNYRIENTVLWSPGQWLELKPMGRFPTFGEYPDSVVKFVLETRAHFYQHGLTLIPAWISNNIHYKVWDEITYPFLNFNGATIEV